MKLAEIVIILFIMFVLSLASFRNSQSRDEADLARDVGTVSDVALSYANLECSSPAGAVTLATATSALGMTARVQHPNRWLIVLTPRPGADRACDLTPVLDRSRYLAVGSSAGYLPGCCPNGPCRSVHPSQARLPESARVSGAVGKYTMLINRGNNENQRL